MARSPSRATRGASEPLADERRRRISIDRGPLYRVAGTHGALFDTDGGDAPVQPRRRGAVASSRARDSSAQPLTRCDSPAMPSTEGGARPSRAVQYGPGGSPERGHRASSPGVTPEPGGTPMIKRLLIILTLGAALAACSPSGSTTSNAPTVAPAASSAPSESAPSAAPSAS